MSKLLIHYNFSQEIVQHVHEKYAILNPFFSYTKDDLLKQISEAEVLVIFSCSQELLEKASKLKWLQVLSAGVDNLPLDYLKTRNINLTNVRGIHRDQMSEYAIWAMISLARNTHILARNQAKKTWDNAVPQAEINGATVGILGLGSVGQEIARKATTLGMQVIGTKNTPTKLDYVEKVYPETEIKEVFAQSDYVINLLPLTSQTEQLIDHSFFSVMPEHACFINISRGGTVNEVDLITALKAEKIRALVSDVFVEEPLPETSPLWELDNVIITPHICGFSPKYGEKAFAIIEHNLDAYLSGSKLLNLVNLTKGY